ncbi:MAG: 2-oxoglutarate dehydrogenase complex dihydrolipoyllysine-residue succinyltransferase [Bacteriovoracaceae bacterium]|nr:2-oxoglutarate dehydrogenase complex dihydrolipoyllysine-residue succinyltransferase [Bacteriovoracaceae bacterium]
MSIEIKIPSIGESITEVTLTTWLKEDGEFVEEGDILCEIESDKATVELPAEESGVLARSVEEGSELGIGAVIGTLTPGEGAPVKKKEESASSGESAPPSVPAPAGGDKNFPSPAARKILDEKGLSPQDVQGTGKDGRITKADAMSGTKPAAAVEKAAAPKPIEAQTPQTGVSREVRREKMSRLRKTIASRLTEAKNSTAMLTTFNEIDMHWVMELRSKYKEQFKEKHEIGLGFMSFFTKACTIALKEVPGVNAMLEGDEMIFHDYADVGIAVSTPKGLVVPVIRNAEALSLAQIEKEIKRLALKGRDGKLTLDEMSGGTFTITNGGVFGSMLSTPIINIPQSGILGMHNIVERPVAIKGQVVVHPVMYTALSYDHRIVDGKESVTFLYRLKELIEDPSRMLLDV